MINSLKRARVAHVGNTPGVTRALQEVHLDKHVKLVDCPGIVFSKGDDAAAALRNCVKVRGGGAGLAGAGWGCAPAQPWHPLPLAPPQVERLSDPVAPVAEILRRVPVKHLMRLYNVPAFTSAAHFLSHVAKAGGRLRPGGTPDVEAAARIVLQARAGVQARVRQGRPPSHASPDSPHAMTGPRTGTAAASPTSRRPRRARTATWRWRARGWCRSGRLSLT